MNDAHINILMKIIPHAKHLLSLCLKLKTGFVDFQELYCCTTGYGIPMERQF